MRGTPISACYLHLQETLTLATEQHLQASPYCLCCCIYHPPPTHILFLIKCFFCSFYSTRITSLVEKHCCVCQPWPCWCVTACIKTLTGLLFVSPTLWAFKTWSQRSQLVKFSAGCLARGSNPCDADKQRRCSALWEDASVKKKPCPG